jgi:hypothetical protein
MNVAIFGGFDRRPFPPGWSKETLVAVLGGGEVDLSESPPAGVGVLTGVAVLGGIDLRVAAGTRVSMSGFSLFGGRSVNVREGDGPLIRMRLFAVFAGIEVKEYDPAAAE